MSDPFTTGKKLVAEWLDRHEYFVAFNADEIKEGEEVEPSRMRGKFIRVQGSRMGEALHFDCESLEQLIDNLDTEIGYGSYLYEEGGNQVNYPADYGFNSVQEAKEAFEVWVKTPYPQLELSRLAELRKIKEMIQ